MLGAPHHVFFVPKKTNQTPCGILQKNLSHSGQYAGQILRVLPDALAREGALPNALSIPNYTLGYMQIWGCTRKGRVPKKRTGGWPSKKERAQNPPVRRSLDNCCRGQCSRCALCGWNSWPFGFLAMSCLHVRFARVTSRGSMDRGIQYTS